MLNGYCIINYYEVIIETHIGAMMLLQFKGDFCMAGAGKFVGKLRVKCIGSLSL